MIESATTVKGWNLSQNCTELWKLLPLVAIIVTFVWFSLRLRKFNRKLPGRKVRLFNPFGNLLELPYKSKARNGYHINVYVLHFLSGYSHLFRKQKLFRIWVSYAPFVALIKAEAVEALLSENRFLEKAWPYKFLHPWLGTGLLTSHGSKWKSRRKLLTPSFHFDILKEFLPVFNGQAQVLVKKLTNEIHKDFTDLVNPITLCSLDIICETTLGVKIGAQENSESKYVRAVSRISGTIFDRGLRIWLWPDWTFGLSDFGISFKKDLKLLHEFTMSMIQEKKKKLLSSDANKVHKRKRKALMDILLDHHIQTKDLTEEDIREEVDTFTFEGHDTTSMAMIWALYLIGLHQDVQQKVHEELDTIFGDDTERPVTTEDLNDMKYLDCVLKESQRLYPSVPFYGRQATEDMDICGYTIPKGATVSVLTYALHRDEEIFPIPEKFYPDRFLPENSINRNPYAYVPFSAGPRNCIGQRFAAMEEKIVISTVLRSFDLRSLDHRDKIETTAELVLRPVGPIRVRIISRTR